ncbi:MAG: hypothetical protein RIS56_1216 [Verrucomicrobiota bacterium]|jgi:hypothetical protein
MNKKLAMACLATSVIIAPAAIKAMIDEPNQSWDARIGIGDCYSTNTDGGFNEWFMGSNSSMVWGDEGTGGYIQPLDHWIVNDNLSSPGNGLSYMFSNWN